MKNLKPLVSFTLMAMFCFMFQANVNAQSLSQSSSCYTCYSSGALSIPGNVGIGTGPTGLNALMVYSSTGHGVAPLATHSTCSAVHARSTGSQGTGVYGKGYYGIYGHAATSSAYAGYFSGKVKITGTLYQGSDKKLKKNIKSINSALSKVLQLDGRAYDFRLDEYQDMNFAAGTQFGFIAQELEAVFPELVEDTEHHVFSEGEDGERSLEETISYKSVNYLALIPVLTEAIKEQNETIETQQKLIHDLQARMAQIEASSSSNKMNTNSTNTKGALKQNSPNPFSAETSIHFELPKKYEQAHILIHDMQGNQIKKFTLNGSENGKISLNAGDLSIGMYSYSLVVDYQVINTLKMILTK